jgi:HAMP domain-containing protein
MSAATATTRKAKPRSKPKLTKAERTAINNENAKKSTGPRTAAGKKKSSFNALKHGLTARTVLLPGEDEAALAARQQHLVDAFQPRNSVELAVIEGMAGDMWRSNRSDLALGRRIAFRLRHEPLEQANIEQNEAVELGGRLFWQPSFPLPISRQIPLGKVSEPLCSENAVHPHHPVRICLRLEQTIPGCDWLIGSWGDLLVRLYSDELWLSVDAFKMVRLMGKHAIDMADDLAVTRVFLHSLTLLSAAPKAPPERESFDWQNALIKMLISFDIENTHGVATAIANQCDPFARRLAELPLAKLAPLDDEDARGRLTAIIEQEIRRLRHIRQTLQEIADLDAAEAPARLAFETGPEGDRYRRYGQTNERQVIRRFDQFLKTRTKTEAGEFDSVDVDLQDLLGVAQPVANVRPTIEPPDALSGEWRVGNGERGAVELDAAMPAVRERQMPAPSLEEATCCDEEHSLRNEANLSEIVSDQLSVARRLKRSRSPVRRTNLIVIRCQWSVVSC